MTILHRYVDHGGQELAIIVPIFLLFIALRTLYVIYDTCYPGRIGTTVLGIFCVAAIFGAFALGSALMYSIDTNRLKVIITEPVNLNEFLSKYSIVKVEGDIIVLEELSTSQTDGEDARHD